MFAFQRISFDVFRPTGRIPGARIGGREGRLADRLGGLGGEANQGRRPAGGTTCPACPHRRSRFSVLVTLHHLISHFISSSRCFLHQSANLFRTSLHFAFVAFALVFLSSACTTTSRSDSQMLRVLDAESQLLEKLKEQRRHPPLLKKIYADDALAEAEANLRDSIDALVKANAELRSTVKQR